MSWRGELHRVRESKYDQPKDTSEVGCPLVPKRDTTLPCVTHEMLCRREGLRGR